MKAFEVSKNGRYLLTAGIGVEGVIVAGVNWTGSSPPRPVGGEFSFHVGGLDSDTGESVVWSVPKVGVGDEITVKIVETDQISPEHRRGIINLSVPGESREDTAKRLDAEGWGD